MANGVITWNGVASDTLGIIVRKVPSLNRPQRKYNSYSVPGRNGDIVVMQDAYADYEQEYEIFALDGAQIDARAIADWLYQDGWCELSDDWEPDYYRMAYFVGPVDIEPIMEEAAVCTITFRCKPQRYYAHGINQFPKLRAGTYAENGVTVTVDNDGVTTISGTAGSGGSTRLIPLESSFTFTQDMVRYATRIYLKNTLVSDDVRLYFRNNSNYVINCLIREQNTNIQVPNVAVGKTVSFIELYVPENVSVRGTIKPEVKTLRPTIRVNSGDTVNNPTNHTAYPIITMTGSEIVTSMLNLETPYNISLDSSSPNWRSEWLSNIAFMYNSITSDWTGSKYMAISTYRQSGTPASEGASLISHVNSTGTLRFKPFRWVNSNVGIGRGMTLTADTNYTISCTTSEGESKLWIGFFESEGNKKYYSSVEVSRSGAGEMSKSFRVPTNCSNVLFIFYRTDNTEGTFSNIMLAAGTEVFPFQPYASLATESITIGNTTLLFTTSGFDTAVIDCEKENFTIDGVNANANSTVIDQYGNLATDYLQLDKGDNIVTYTSDITAVSIEPNFWEL